MFVTQERFILKTCGTTTLLLAIEPLLELVKDQCGFDTVAVCISLGNIVHGPSLSPAYPMGAISIERLISIILK